MRDFNSRVAASYDPGYPPEYDEDDTGRCFHCGDSITDDPTEGTPELEGFCSPECQSGERVIVRTVSDLGEWVGAVCRDENDATRPTDDIIASIARRLYKATRCGISFWTFAGGVGVAGYCEGQDGEFQSYTLSFPFSASDFDAAVANADDDGCERWNETHGCDRCEADGFVDEMGEAGPVNPECPECEGDGRVI